MSTATPSHPTKITNQDRVLTASDSSFDSAPPLTLLLNNSHPHRALKRGNVLGESEMDCESVSSASSCREEEVDVSRRIGNSVEIEQNLNICTTTTTTTTAAAAAATTATSMPTATKSVSCTSIVNNSAVSKSNENLDTPSSIGAVTFTTSSSTRDLGATSVGLDSSSNVDAYLGTQTSASTSSASTSFDYLTINLDAYGMKNVKIELNTDDTNRSVNACDVMPSATTTTTPTPTADNCVPVLSSPFRSFPQVVAKSGISAPDGEMLVVLNMKGEIETLDLNRTTREFANSSTTVPVSVNGDTPSQHPKDLLPSTVVKNCNKRINKRGKELKQTGSGVSISREKVKGNKKSSTKSRTTGEKFPESSDFLIHGWTHAEQKSVYDCVICGSVYTTFNDLKSHQMTHVGSKSHTCSVCGNAFSCTPFTQSEFKLKTNSHSHTDKRQDHSEQESIDQDYESDSCGPEIFSSEPVKEQEKTTHVVKPSECLICGKKYSRPSYLQAHVKNHTSGEKQFTCEVCGKTFSTKRHLTRHARHHVNEKQHCCTICGKAFFAKSTLMGHIRSHTGERPYSCQVCGKTFGSQSSHSKHVKIHGGEKKHQCSTCGKAFLQFRYLKVHLRTHTGEKPYACTTCDKAFSTQSALTCHVRTHTGQKPYACTLCSLAFTTSSDLQTHLRRHKGERPYLCTTCGKSFSCCTGLSLHKRIHTGVKAYKCEDCGKQFTTVSSLHVHKRIHTGLKPFQCLACSKAFIHKSHLQRHAKIHERESIM